MSQRAVDESFMWAAIRRAEVAQINGSRAFGCVIAQRFDVVEFAEGSERLLDPTWHSECEAIRRAVVQLGTANLSDCTLYSTHEPCVMCCGAINHAKLGRVVWGSQRADLPDLFRQRKAQTHAIQLLLDTTTPPDITTGVLREECIALFDLERQLMAA